MSDGPDITPPRSIVPSAAPQPAQVRPGHHAPRMDVGGLPEARTLAEAIEIAEDAFEIARNPFEDAAYQKVRPILEKAHQALLKDLDSDTDLLNRVRRLLGKPPLVL